MNQTTPKKRASCRGRKPKKEPTASDDCRLCGCCFKTQFGNFKTGWITTENIFTAPQRKGKTLPMLAEVFRADLSLDVEENNSLSSRVISPCGTKVRNCATMLSQIKEKLNKPNPAFTMGANNDPTNGEQEVLRMKRMSKSPHYSKKKKYSRVSTQQAPLFPEQHQPLQSLLLTDRWQLTTKSRKTRKTLFQNFLQQNRSHNGTSPPKLQLLLKLIMAIPRKGQD